MTISVSLYHNFSPDNYLTKNLELVGTATGTLLEDFSYSTPTIRLDLSGAEVPSPKTFNYFGALGYYYFVEDLVVGPTGIQSVQGRIDVLGTYSDAIGLLRVRAERSTSHGSSKLVDPERLISASSSKMVVNFPNSIPEDSRSGTYVLTTAQSGYGV